MGSLARQGTLSKDAGSGLFSLTLDELQNEIVGSGIFLGSMNMVSTRLACTAPGNKGGECGACAGGLGCQVVFCWFALVGSLQWRPTCDCPPHLPILGTLRVQLDAGGQQHRGVALRGSCESSGICVTVRSGTGPQPGSQHRLQA